MVCVCVHRAAWGECVCVCVHEDWAAFLLWEFPICPVLMRLSLRVLMEASRAAQSVAVCPGFNGETGGGASGR